MRTSVTKPQFPSQKKGGMSAWKSIALCMVLVLVPWAIYVNVHPRVETAAANATPPKLTPAEEAVLLTLKDKLLNAGGGLRLSPTDKTPAVVTPPVVTPPVVAPPVVIAPPKRAVKKIVIPELPVQGPIVTNGAQPLYGIKHKGTDAIFALACNYPKLYYQRFVGSLRKFGYNEDIVLAVSPEDKMKPGIKEYVKSANIVAYAFDVDCAGTDNCKLKDDFLGYPDPRPHRTFANIRYALYEYWLKQYNENSYILILDFRDTFFQANPFQEFGAYDARDKSNPQYVLQVFAENHKVKTIGNCVYNSMWVGKCFGKPALEAIKENAVICSGSTMGSFLAVSYYVRTMLASMDTVKCWLKGIESDQGYQSHLFYNGHFNTEMGNATVYQQGYGNVNTIGALNGFRVPAHMKGPLDTHWKIRDKEGFILNYDGTRSACVHQWDRWHDELHAFVDSKLFDKNL